MFQLQIINHSASAGASASAVVLVGNELKLVAILRSNKRDIPLWGCACVTEGIVPLIRAKRALENIPYSIGWHVGVGWMREGDRERVLQ